MGGAAGIQFDDKQAGIGEDRLAGGVAKLARSPRAVNQLRGIDAPRIHEVVHDFRAFVVEVGIDRVDKAHLLEREVNGRIFGGGDREDGAAPELIGLAPDAGVVAFGIRIEGLGEFKGGREFVEQLSAHRCFGVLPGLGHGAEGAPACGDGERVGLDPTGGIEGTANPLFFAKQGDIDQVGFTQIAGGQRPVGHVTDDFKQVFAFSRAGCDGGEGDGPVVPEFEGAGELDAEFGARGEVDFGFGEADDGGRGASEDGVDERIPEEKIPGDARHAVTEGVGGADAKDLAFRVNGFAGGFNPRDSGGDRERGAVWKFEGVEIKINRSPAPAKPESELADSREFAPDPAANRDQSPVIHPHGGNDPGADRRTGLRGIAGNRLQQPDFQPSSLRRDPGRGWDGIRRTEQEEDREEYQSISLLYPGRLSFLPNLGLVEGQADAGCVGAVVLFRPGGDWTGSATNPIFHSSQPKMGIDAPVSG